MRNIILIIVTILSCSSMKKENFQTMDYVPNQETAIKIAEAIWLPLYGESIYEKKPYKATLIDNNIWRVEGTLDSEKIGGVPIIEIQKKDCKVLKVTHTK